MAHNTGLLYDPADPAQRHLPFPPYTIFQKSLEANAAIPSTGHNAYLSVARRICDSILKYHAMSNGEFRTLYDTSCGIGNFKRQLAVHFNEAYGVDPSYDNILFAQSQSQASRFPETLKGGPITFEVQEPDIDWNGPSFVDLLTVLGPIHDFNLSAFWRMASNMVKPGGTVAIITPVPRLIVHPSTPNAPLVQHHCDVMEHWLHKFEDSGWCHAAKYNDHLTLPWHLQKQPVAFSSAPQHFKKVDHDRRRDPNDQRDLFLDTSSISVAHLKSWYECTPMYKKWSRGDIMKVGTNEDLSHTTAQALEGTVGDGVIVVGCGAVSLLFKRV